MRIPRKCTCRDCSIAINLPVTSVILINTQICLGGMTIITKKTANSRYF